MFYFRVAKLASLHVLQPWHPRCTWQAWLHMKILFTCFPRRDAAFSVAWKLRLWLLGSLMGTLDTPSKLLSLLSVEAFGSQFGKSARMKEMSSGIPEMSPAPLATDSKSGGRLTPHP